MGLPDSFFPRKTFDLVRLGGAADGGYLVERASLDRASSLVSFGIGPDWSFERDFLRFGAGSVVLEAHDGFHPLESLSKEVAGALVQVALSAPFRPRKLPSQAVRGARALRELSTWLLLFRGRRRFHRGWVGNSSSGAKSLARVLDEEGPPEPVFVKADVEGAEYRMLDDLAANAGRFCGLVVEFHDIDLHRERIGDFIGRFGMDLVHVHPNNMGGADPSGNPLVVEMTFAKDPRPVSESPSIPHAWDRPNAAHLPDVGFPG